MNESDATVGLGLLFFKEGSKYRVKHNIFYKKEQYFTFGIKEFAMRLDNRVLFS